MSTRSPRPRSSSASVRTTPSSPTTPAAARRRSEASQAFAKVLKQGDFVNCITAVASLDSKEFADPLNADFERSPNRHCAFVFGPHRCMGSNLARLEIRIALEEWLNRIPDFSIADDADIDVNLGAVVSLAKLPLVW